MHQTDFQFDLAIQSAMTSWIGGNNGLINSCKNPEKLFKWRQGQLAVNLDAMAEDYFGQYIQPAYVSYCRELLIQMKDPLAEFLFFYDFPEINLSVKFNCRDKHYAKQLLIKPYC
jgi:hypothetical protein